jgi:hypothetical protein
MIKASQPKTILDLTVTKTLLISGPTKSEHEGFTNLLEPVQKSHWGSPKNVLGVLRRGSGRTEEI